MFWQTASLDPRSCGLTYLPNESCQAILKQELLQQLSKLETSGLSTDESGQPPSKKKKTKDKGYELDFFFGDVDADKDCSQSMLLQQELNTYFTERPPPANTQPLTWWRMNAPCYPFFSILARKFLCIPATSVPLEGYFQLLATLSLS